MVRNAREDELEGWLNEAENGLRRDQADVAAALREPWSNELTEGQINRLGELYRHFDCDRHSLSWSALEPPHEGSGNIGCLN